MKATAPAVAFENFHDLSYFARCAIELRVSQGRPRGAALLTDLHRRVVNGLYLDWIVDMRYRRSGISALDAWTSLVNTWWVRTHWTHLLSVLECPRKLSVIRPPAFATLVERLAEEWGKPTTLVEPVILEESTAFDDTQRVYVVWSDWAQLGRDIRGEIIMEAAERVKARSDLLKINIAMGLTPEEADRFGLNWR